MIKITLAEIQTEHSKFVGAMGWQNSKTPLEAVALIHEEAAELGHELRQTEINEEAVGQELSDLILRTVDLASDLNINLSMAVINKMTHNFSNIQHHKSKGRHL